MQQLGTPQQLEPIAYWLRQTSGFNPEVLGWDMFAKIIAKRMSLNVITDYANYRKLLDNSTSERTALIEATVIPETWFFRDASAFSALKQIAITMRHRNMPLRILSLPCSSGEEPYSIAITLRELGLVPTQFYIDAVDISPTAIDKARQAIYTENAFRGNELDFKDSYFIPKAHTYKLVDTIRGDVNFSVNNFFIPQFLQYDIIFCRNLLIYFDQDMRRQAFVHLHSLLDPNGLLFLGHAEAIQATYHGWATTSYPNVFRKASPMSPLSVAAVYLTKLK